MHFAQFEMNLLEHCIITQHYNLKKSKLCKTLFLKENTILLDNL